MSAFSAVSIRVGGNQRAAAVKSFGAALLLVLAACSASRGPVIGTGERTPAQGGTISGTVRAVDSDRPLSARQVTAVNVATGEKIVTSTAMNGGYTIKVPPGRYRLEIELRAGEAVSRAPDEVEISDSDLDASRNFVIRPQGSGI